MSRMPNKRLKLTGGDRFSGTGVLCPWRGTDCRPTPLRRRAGRPQLKRDPLGCCTREMDDFHIAAHSSRGVLFEHVDEPEFIYYGVGSGVVFTWEGRGYFATAEHVANKGRDHTIRIAVDDEGRECYPFDKSYGIHADDEDWKDIRFYRIAKGTDEGRWFGKVLALDLAKLSRGQRLYHTGAELLVSGYPNTARYVDYQAYHISMQRQLIPARYDSPDPTARLKHLIRIATGNEVTSFDGLSGAPVIAGTPQGTAFLGMVIQGTVSSGVAYMIDGAVFAKFLQYAVTEAAA